MGYTHYWYRPTVINQTAFNRIVADFRRLVPVLEAVGIPLAGYDGRGSLSLTDEAIRFNGVAKCGHPEDHAVAIAWPTATAAGVRTNPLADPKAGRWFAGAEIQTRACEGDCSHETFALIRTYTPKTWETPEKGLYFEFCKTAFKPYDVAVTAALVIAKHYLGDRLTVRSDGTLTHWQDAMMLCQIELNYGLGFGLDEEAEEAPP